MKGLFTAALELPPDERESFVAQCCIEDPQMERDVREMLRAFAIEDDFIERPAAGKLGWAAATAGTDWVGRRIGPYRVVAEAGRGGIGRVFRAVRDDGEVEQQVAIKVLHPGFGTPALLARFRVERRILARLNHPNIAHFLDGGATEDGAPWLAMEYVEGEPIDEYCEQHALGLEARLQLFRDLCSAVHHVHQNLLVHGDLKGGNVLVTSAGQVKLLDFGIAKLLDPMAGDTGRPATLLMMTPDYASPEQRRGESITTASDVYSLGALLYVLLAGSTVKKASSAADVAPGDVYEQPTLPSVAAARSERVQAAFARELRGDLDTIAIKALKPEPHERYGSAEQLADDIQRYLRGFPIEARPDSTSYRIRKFAQRNSVAAAATAVALIAMIGGTAVALWQAHNARIEHERAQRHFETVRQLSSIFLGDVHDAIAKIPGSTGARKLLVDKTLEYLNALERDAPDSIELRRDLGVAWERLADVQGAYITPSLGERNEALASYRHSVSIRQALVDEQPIPRHLNELVSVQVNLGQALLGSDLTDEAKTVLGDAVKNADILLAARTTVADRRTAASAYMNYGWQLWVEGNGEASLQPLDKARQLTETILAENPADERSRRDAALALGRIGQAHMMGTGKYEEALSFYRRSSEISAALATEVQDNLEYQVMRAYAQVTIGQLNVILLQPDAAVRVLEPEIPRLDGWRKADPADVVAPIAVGAAQNLLGEARTQLGQYDAALAHFAVAEKYLTPDLENAIGDLRVLYGQMLAGQAQAQAGASLQRADAETRSAGLAKATDLASRAVVVLKPLAEKGGNMLEARRLMAIARSVLESA